jgi:hypothetical protein
MDGCPLTVLICSHPVLLKASKNFNMYIQVFCETEIRIDAVEVCKSCQDIY